MADEHELDQGEIERLLSQSDENASTEPTGESPNAKESEDIGLDQGLVDGGVKKVIVDCRKLTYVSDRGLFKLLQEKRDLAERGGQIRLTYVTGRLVKILTMLGLNERFDLYPDVHTARGSFGDLL